MSDQSAKSSAIIAEIHALLHTAESAKGNITYLDVNRICNHIASSHFPEGLPQAIKSAFDQASKSCHPQSIERINKRHLVVGLGLILIGALPAVIGVGLITASGLTSPQPASLLQKIGRALASIVQPPSPPPESVNLVGIVLAVVGIILVIAGVYVARRRSNPNFQASVAENILRDALHTWGSGDEDAPPALPQSPAG
jgi:uncharacterized membrane protein